MDAAKKLVNDISAKTGLPPWAVTVGLTTIAATVGPKVINAVLPPKRLTQGKGLKVVVTGCDTGFGRLTALNLTEKGFVVFAGCLTDKGIESLNALNFPTLKPFKMDVTKDADVKAAREMLEKECPEGLYALINNAGVHAGYKWELTPLDLVYKDMEVNYFGVVRVTMSLLPLLRKYVAKKSADMPPPRVITITSIAGSIQAAPLGSYMASKHAAQVFGITLRQEVRNQGILCSLIEPYYARTPLVTHIDQRKIDRVLSNPEEVIKAYGGKEDIRKRMSRNAFHAPTGQLLEPEEVVTALINQVSLWKPTAHNLIGKEAHALSWAFKLVPAYVLDPIVLLNDEREM